MIISIVGAGKMAHQLGINFKDAGHNILEVYNRTTRKGKQLSTLLDARFESALNKLSNEIDVLIIAVSDDAINHIADTLERSKWKDVLVVHTSGSASLGLLKEHKRVGVFYPFQSMRIDQKVNFSEVPILITCQNNTDKEALKTLANSITKKCFEINDKQRSVLHIAGVFANNFTNHLITISKDLMEQNDLNYEIIKPLINNTFDKLKNDDPVDCQTGPAVRGDQQTILNHLNWLEEHTELYELYGMLTKSIIERHK